MAAAEEPTGEAGKTAAQKGCHYAGSSRDGRCTGYGRYTYKSGVVYEGEFQDDLYHGKGQIVYPDKTIFKGIWDKGKLVEGQLYFPDGLMFDSGMPGSGLFDADKPWGYCDGCDRRFWSEIQNDLSGKAPLAAVEPLPQIPKDAMDVGNGYYDIDQRKVYGYEGNFKRNVDDNEHFWIISTCRKGWMEETGRSPTTHL